MNRRELILVLMGGAMTSAPGLRAEEAGRMRRIGVLLGVSASDPEYQRRIAVLREALGELGWMEETTAFELRFAEGKLDRLPALAAELAHAKVDVIVTQGTEVTDAARKATTTIPIVMAAIGDAVGAGIVASLARPGGNITGLTMVATEQSTKRLQLIKEISPSLVRACVLWNGNNTSHRLQLKEMEVAAPVLGLQLQSVPVRDARELDTSVEAAMQASNQAIVTMDDALIVFLRTRIIELAMRHKVPVMGELRPMAATGGLMSYGPNQIEMWRHAAGYIDKIFRGAKPADLPVQQPTKFELVVNLNSAKALGLTIPYQILALADEVIE